MLETPAQDVSESDEGPSVPPDELPETVIDAPVEGVDEFELEVEEAAERVLAGPTLEEPGLYEAPGRQTSVYEDERATDERTKLDTFIANMRQTAGAEGMVDIERTGPVRSCPPELIGRLSRVNVSELENIDVPGYIQENWGGGEYRLAIRDGHQRYRAWVTVKIAGKPRSMDPEEHGSESNALVSLMKDMLGKMQENTGGGNSEVLRMMEMRMAEEKEQRKAEAEAAVLASKERIEQMRLDQAAQLQMMTTLMAAQRPTSDPLELALKLSDSATKGYQESAKFAQKAMSQTLTTSVELSGKVNLSIVQNALATLRATHESEADQSFLDKVMNVAGTLAGPAQEAIKTLAGNQGATEPDAPPAPGPAAPPAPRLVTAPPPPPPPAPGPGGSLPRADAVPAVAAPALPDMTPEQLERLKEQAETGALIALDRTATFLQVLNIQLMTDPDPEQAWTETEPHYRAMPGKLRDLVEAATEEIPESDSPLELLPFGEKLLNVFEQLIGPADEKEPAQCTQLRNNIEAVKMTVLSDLSKAIWLRDFFEVAPWQPEEEDPEDDGDEDVGGDEDLDVLGDEDPAADGSTAPGPSPEVSAPAAVDVPHEDDEDDAYARDLGPVSGATKEAPAKGGDG